MVISGVQRGEKEKLSGGNTVDDVYWHEENSGNKSQLVGQKRLNGLQLYDMLGNVYKWCIDTYLVGYYSQNPKQGPVTKEVSSERTRRGGVRTAKSATNVPTTGLPGIKIATEMNIPVSDWRCLCRMNHRKGTPAPPPQEAE